jgi:Holliday junction resolvasome RuvABC endonuclease subunit
MSYVVGIDPSLTGLALCVFQKTRSGLDVETPRLWRFTSAPAPTLYQRMERYAKLRNQVMNTLDGLGKPELVFLEGYAFGKSGGNAMLDLAELGGLLRNALCRWSPNVREVNPSLVKKFATGKGNSKKEMVMAHVAQRWGHIFDSNDECDAYVLGRMALVAAEWIEAEVKHQGEAAVEALRGTVRKSKKKKIAA